MVGGPESGGQVFAQERPLAVRDVAGGKAGALQEARDRRRRPFLERALAAPRPAEVRPEGALAELEEVEEGVMRGDRPRPGVRPERVARSRLPDLPIDPLPLGGGRRRPAREERVEGQVVPLGEEDLLDPLYFGKQKRGLNDSFLNGNILYASASLVGETTRFNPYWGPSAGSTYRLSLTQSLPLGKSLIKNTSAEADLRKYFNLGADLVLAFRWYGFASRGKNPYLFYYGGNNQVRSAYFYNIIATEGWYGNAELRFTLLASTPTFLGNFGPVRGTLFFDVTRSKVKGYPPYFYRETYSSASFPDVGGGTEIGQFEAMGSYGYGIQLFFLGLPIHLDWAKELQFPRFSDPLGVKAFGGFKLKFWIGFDF